MKQSKTLAAAEKEQRSTGKMPELGVDLDKFIGMTNGFFKVSPIQCYGDYVAIAPFPRSEITEGGIVVPGQADVRPDTGIIVGLGEHPGKIKLGEHVKFVPHHKVADLTGEFPFYGGVEIAVYKTASVVATLPQVKAKMVVQTGPIKPVSYNCQ